MFGGLAYYEAKLYFVVYVHVAGDLDGGLVVWRWEDARAWFEEEEGVFGALVVEFSDVVGIVPAYAHDFAGVGFEGCHGGDDGGGSGGDDDSVACEDL